MTLAKWAVVAAMVLFSFALALYVAPDVRHRWEWTSPGTLAGTLGFLGLCWLFRVYVQNFGSFDQRYGSLGGLMVLSLWSWAAGWLLLVAAELNQVIEDAAPAGRTYGQKVDPGVAGLLK